VNDVVAPTTVRVIERQTPRTARYALVGAEPAAASHIWFVLHGYGQLASRFVKSFESITPEGTCIVAPEGLSRFYLAAPRADGSHMQRVGASWLTREARDAEIADGMHWLNLVYDDIVGASTAGRGTAPSVGVLGFSQGVATMMRWIAMGAIHPQHVVLWAGTVAHDADAHALRAKLALANVSLVAGRSDEFVTDETRAATLHALHDLNVTPRELVFDGAHHLDEDTLKALLHEVSR